MLEQLLQYNDLGLFLLRLVVAVIFLRHGVPKLLQAKSMASGMGAPTVAVFLLGFVETLSAIYLVIHFYTQLSALLLALIMIGAIIMKITKWRVPFMAHDKTGWEFDLILLAANIVILLSGGGTIGIL